MNGRKARDVRRISESLAEHPGYRKLGVSAKTIARRMRRTGRYVTLLNDGTILGAQR